MCRARCPGIIARAKTIAGAPHTPHGMLEFMAGTDIQYHNAALKPGAYIYLVCGAGGQAALAGKTLRDMGYTSTISIGGISEWSEAGGPMKDA